MRPRRSSRSRPCRRPSRSGRCPQFYYIICVLLVLCICYFNIAWFLYGIHVVNTLSEHYPPPRGASPSISSSYIATLVASSAALSVGIGVSSSFLAPAFGTRQSSTFQYIFIYVYIYIYIERERDIIHVIHT